MEPNIKGAPLSPNGTSAGMAACGRLRAPDQASATGQTIATGQAIATGPFKGLSKRERGFRKGAGPYVIEIVKNTFLHELDVFLSIFDFDTTKLIVSTRRIQIFNQKIHSSHFGRFQNSSSLVRIVHY